MKRLFVILISLNIIGKNVNLWLPQSLWLICQNSIRGQILYQV